MKEDDGVIVVGIDGSDDADRAVEWAVGEAHLHGDKVLLVHAWQFPAVGMTKYGGETVPVFGRDDIQRLAEELLEKAQKQTTKLDSTVEVDTQLVQGHSGAALIEASRQARLLVVGSRGLGGFAGMLMGSVSSSCAHHAYCPVVIVRPGA